MTVQNYAALDELLIRRVAKRLVAANIWAFGSACRFISCRCRGSAGRGGSSETWTTPDVCGGVDTCGVYNPCGSFGASGILFLSKVIV